MLICFFDIANQKYKFTVRQAIHLIIQMLKTRISKPSVQGIIFDERTHPWIHKFQRFLYNTGNCWRHRYICLSGQVLPYDSWQGKENQTYSSSSGSPYFMGSTQRKIVCHKIFAFFLPDANTFTDVSSASNRQPDNCGLSWPEITVMKTDNIIVFQVVIWPV